MDNLKISLIQTTLAWQNPEANRSHLGEHIDLLHGTDLIILPEMFTTGFSMDSVKLAERMDGPGLTWLADTAARTGAVICGSLIIEEDDRYYNRLVWMRPDGTFSSYDKRHLFRMALEHQHYSPGQHILTVDLNGWVICPQICYDLRFPVWSRNRQGYHLLIYIANWPARRRVPWQILLKARAIENLSYVAGVNRIGVDGNDVEHAGDSAVINYLGEEILTTESQQASATIELDRTALQIFKEGFPAHLDADEFSLQR